MILLAPEIQASLSHYFARRPDVVLAYLFGSQATGTADPGSDVDVAVALAAEADGVLGAMVEIEDELGGSPPGQAD